jgi:hypothetical protein
MVRAGQPQRAILLAAEAPRGNLAPMSDDRMSNALRRIAAAMERIEAVALSPAPQAAVVETGSGDAEKLTELTARHAKLKEETTIALSALDAVIARASAGSRN